MYEDGSEAGKKLTKCDQNTLTFENIKKVEN